MSNNPSEARGRPNAPTNEEELKMMLQSELELFFPIDPDQAIVGATMNPKNGSLILHVRRDGVPASNPPLGGGKFFIALDDEPNVIDETSKDLIEYFKSRNKKAIIGFYPSSKSEMKILRCGVE